ncbi:hypothetical protein NMY3_01682 [Candidatus Nitrosocosmicus oleophilus]|uniref:Uncharacterized protein n=1 Tax=Candidatus Nitrosocosmicus oleophilus TaxID=1353260 RepID=A0A654LXG3_9ARCH|nr:hypothetical protein NMY3_01682 [Candidatus Nitrosocosmicus oleophilus]
MENIVYRHTTAKELCFDLLEIYSESTKVAFIHINSIATKIITNQSLMPTIPKCFLITIPMNSKDLRPFRMDDYSTFPIYEIKGDKD